MAAWARLENDKAAQNKNPHSCPRTSIARVTVALSENGKAVRPLWAASGESVYLCRLADSARPNLSIGAEGVELQPGLALVLGDGAVLANIGDVIGVLVPD